MMSIRILFEFGGGFVAALTAVKACERAFGG